MTLAAASICSDRSCGTYCRRFTECLTQFTWLMCIFDSAYLSKVLHIYCERRGCNARQLAVAERQGIGQDVIGGAESLQRNRGRKRRPDLSGGQQ
jgi:hypothetical protein